MDSSSHCVIWDVTQGMVAAEFSLGAKPLIDLQWLETNVRTSLYLLESQTLLLWWFTVITVGLMQRSVSSHAQSQCHDNMEC